MSKDITAWKVEPDGTVLPQFDDGGVVDGVHDVLQRVLCILLSESGSARYRFGREVARACPFMSSWRHGDMRTEADVIGQFTLGRSYIRAAMLQEQQADDPPEQRYKDLKLDRIVIQPGVVRLEITLVTEAETVQFVLPIPT